MKFPAPVPIQWIADLIQAKLVGNPEGLTTGINEIHRVEKGDLVFVDHPKYYDRCLKSKADFIIINAETAVPTGKSLLICEQPFEAYLKIAAHFRPFMPSDDAISKDAIIGKDTVIQLWNRHRKRRLLF
jgi:UDP-3-O-[3-hydroxymyristoyl] glucosamine N-acyltransferase